MCVYAFVYVICTPHTVAHSLKISIALCLIQHMWLNQCMRVLWWVGCLLFLFESVLFSVSVWLSYMLAFMRWFVFFLCCMLKDMFNTKQIAVTSWPIIMYDVMIWWSSSSSQFYVAVVITICVCMCELHILELGSIFYLFHLVCLPLVQPALLSLLWWCADFCLRNVSSVLFTM